MDKSSISDLPFFFFFLLFLLPDMIRDLFACLNRDFWSCRQLLSKSVPYIHWDHGYTTVILCRKSGRINAVSHIWLDLLYWENVVKQRKLILIYFGSYSRSFDIDSERSSHFNDSHMYYYTSISLFLHIFLFSVLHL